MGKLELASKQIPRMVWRLLHKAVRIAYLWGKEGAIVGLPRMVVELLLLLLQELVWLPFVELQLLSAMRRWQSEFNKSRCTAQPVAAAAAAAAAQWWCDASDWVCAKKQMASTCRCSSVPCDVSKTSLPLLLFSALQTIVVAGKPRRMERGAGSSSHSLFFSPAFFCSGLIDKVSTGNPLQDEFINNWFTLLLYRYETQYAGKEKEEAVNGVPLSTSITLQKRVGQGAFL